MNSGRGKLFCKDHKTVALEQDLIAISKAPRNIGFYSFLPYESNSGSIVQIGHEFLFFCINLSQLWFDILYIYQTLWFCKSHKTTFLWAEQFVLPDNLGF
jgi:hypothetical protein